MWKLSGRAGVGAHQHPHAGVSQFAGVSRPFSGSGSRAGRPRSSRNGAGFSMERRMSAHRSGGVRARARGLSRRSGHSAVRPCAIVWIIVGTTQVCRSTRPWMMSG